MEARQSRTAFVLSGGTSLGAIQVGMLQALTGHGIMPDLIVGTSVGAINGAWLAGHPHPSRLEGLAALWRRLTRDHVFPVRPMIAARGLLGRRNHLVSPDGLRALIESHLPFRRLEEARIPLHVIATDLLTGRAVTLSSGDAASALMASAAIPGVYPPVELGHRVLIDGAVSANTPIAQAVRLGARRIYVLPAGRAGRLGRAPATALGVALHALKLLVHRPFAADIVHAHPDIEVHVLPPVPLLVSCTDFSRADELIVRGRETAARWLSDREPAGELEEVPRVAMAG